ncbi:hypothetical protein PG996_013952 [Apiospora saccharicola]|uniref:Uncharacterized protein n=1 Tax=Apiospora saccharicola TaxID=335842 RepID=A0ABR1TJP0_9PEZI
MLFKWLRKKKQKHSSKPHQQQPPVTHDPSDQASANHDGPAPAELTSLTQNSSDDLQFSEVVEDREDLKDLKQLLSRFPAWCAGCSKTIDLSAKNVSRSVRLWWVDRTERTANSVELFKLESSSQWVLSNKRHETDSSNTAPGTGSETRRLLPEGLPKLRKAKTREWQRQHWSFVSDLWPPCYLLAIKHPTRSS